jgi:starch synthase
LLVFIGRFTSQKGMELLIDSLEEIASHSCNIAILGEGEAIYCERLKSIALRYPNIHLTFGYDENQSHRLYAASDFILIPSLFEPCGLNQLIAFRYGAIPIVHHVGGLADTVGVFERFELSAASGYGIVFNRPTKRSFLGAIRKAWTLYEDKNFYKTIVEHNRGCDVSWRKSAHLYTRLYQKLLK